MRAIELSSGAVVALIFLFTSGLAGAVQADPLGCTKGDGLHIRKVCFEDVAGAPIYGHHVLGDTPEWDELTVFWGERTRPRTDGQGGAATTLLLDHVYEDVLPRLFDVDLDGEDEIVVVQSHFEKGARLVVYDTNAALVEIAGPYIGTRHRWLAPVGAADLDGDGHIEIAYVDRPHLAKTLRIWRFKDGTLTEAAMASGYSNHKIGWDFIPGGIRDCGNGAEMILATGNWSHIVAARFDGTTITTRTLGRYEGAKSVDAALRCP
ncbi:MAG: VCBS repeat-containing protein [Pseudomonadota bacterium]